MEQRCTHFKGEKVLRVRDKKVSFLRMGEGIQN